MNEEESALCIDRGNVQMYHAMKNWAGVIKYEGKMEQMMAAAKQDKEKHQILVEFARAHRTMGNQLKAASSYERSIDILGRMQRDR